MARPPQRRQKKSFTFDQRFERNEPVLDADFETIAADANSHKLNPSVVAEAEKTEPKIQADTGMSVFGKKSAQPKPDDKIAFYGFGSILVALSFWVSGGHALFRNVDMMPVAAIRAAKGLPEIADPAWRVVTIDGRSALHVEGIVRNTGTAAMHTQPVTVTVKHQNGSTNRYMLGQKGWTLGPGQEVVVSGRLDIASSNIASVIIALTD